MVMLINGGPDMYAAVAFGPSHPSTLTFLQNQMSNMSQTLSTAGSAFMQRGQELFEKYNGHKALQMAKSAMRATQYMFAADIIQPLYSIGAIQQARPTMQRWIMACPEVRSMYHMQRCDGYSDTYVDMNPGMIGQDHYDYQKVMENIIHEGDEEADYDWKRTNWFTEENTDDVQLTLLEKTDILSLWDLIRPMMKAGKEDPTSPYCTTL